MPATTALAERRAVVRTADGEMPTLVVHPATGPACAVVVMLMDGRGIREGMRENARRLAGAGYYVLLPNLYYRSGADVEDVEGALEEMRQLAAPLTKVSAPADVAACLDFAAADPAASRERPIGLIGYCMGGRLAVVAAQALGDRIAAVASIHPSSMATRSEDSPHLALDRISAEIHFSIPEHDRFLSPGAVARLRGALDAQGVDYTMEILAGEHHGFSTPGNEQYSRPAAERAWTQSLALFERRLAAAD